MASSTPTRLSRSASSLCHTCRLRLLPSSTTRRAAFSSTTPSLASDKPPADPFAPSSASAPSSLFSTPQASRPPRRRYEPAQSPTTAIMSAIGMTDFGGDPSSLINDQISRNANYNPDTDRPHRLHVYATKHNTHITFVQPSRSAALTASSGVSSTTSSAADRSKQIDVLMSLSTGNISFRKAGRGSYDAAYQLTAFVLKQLQERGIAAGVSRLEVVLRGFGAGREAVTKCLLGAEGRSMRGKISGVLDATRLKLGGPRGKKPRRLG